MSSIGVRQLPCRPATRAAWFILSPSGEVAPPGQTTAAGRLLADPYHCNSSGGTTAGSPENRPPYHRNSSGEFVRNSPENRPPIRVGASGLAEDRMYLMGDIRSDPGKTIYRVR